MAKLTADFSSAFSRDLKINSKRRNWNLKDLEEVVNLILQNSKESNDILKNRHRKHKLSGKWKGRCECHVANAGDWLVIWSQNNEVAFFERTGTHDELFK